MAVAAALPSAAGEMDVQQSCGRRCKTTVRSRLPIMSVLLLLSSE
jgi:hypothetical protein